MPAAENRSDKRPRRTLKQAERANNELARERRDALRELLHAAALRGLLPFGTTRVADFSSDSIGSPEAGFVEVDEDLEGDTEFNPVML